MRPGTSLVDQMQLRSAIASGSHPFPSALGKIDPINNKEIKKALS